MFNTPVFYESESSAGYYRKSFAETNNSLFFSTNGPGSDYDAARADTFQQLLLPETFFGWLNVTPRAGGRVTYYSEESGPAGTNSETWRRVFNTGVDVSFKSSQLWTGATNSLLDMDGLRHIVEPSMSYAYVPRPSTPPQSIAAVRLRSCPACCCCPFNCPITTTLIRLTARTSSASACATRSRPSAPPDSRIC